MEASDLTRVKELEAKDARLKRMYAQMALGHGGNEEPDRKKAVGPEQKPKTNAMAIQYIQPGKANQNAYIERFNRILRDEVLSQLRFARIDDVREAA